MANLTHLVTISTKLKSPVATGVNTGVRFCE